MQIEELIELLKNNEFDKAEKSIKQIISNNEQKEEWSKLYNMLGMIEERKEEKNDIKAKQYYEKSIGCIPIFKPSYYCYDNLENDNNIAIGYLKKGLKDFQNDLELYSRLFKRESEKEKIKIINYFIDNNMVDEEIYNQFIQFTYNNKYYELTIVLIDEINNKKFHKNELYNLIKLSADILLNDEIKDINKKINIVKNIINDDIKNKLKYLHYIILIYLELLNNNKEGAVEVLNRLDLKTQLEDFYVWEYEPDIDLSDLYLKIFDIFEKNFNNEIQAKVRIIKYNYLNNKVNNGEEVKYKVKDIKDLISTLKYYEQEKKIYFTILDMYINMEKYYEAFEFVIKYYTQSEDARLAFNKQNYFDIFYEYLKDNELIKIVNKLIVVKDNINNYDISIIDLLRVFIDDLVEELFKRKMYDYIGRLVKDIKFRDLIRIKNIFEIAYSHNDKKVARQLYEHLLEDNPKNSAYNNNLGVIYKEEGNLFKARDYFKIALEADPEDDISASNLKDVNKRINDLYEAYEEVQKEQVWILSKLELLYEQVKDGIITCSYNERPKILKTSPEKAQELFDTFTNKKYIVKIKSQDDWGRNQYRFNELICDYLQERKEYIKANKEYENISENINIDYLSSIGYTDELKNKISKIEDKGIVEILLRDFKECAIAMASKQEKSAIVLSGSMTEALLNYKVREKGIKSYKLIKDGEERKIKIKDMGLADLLEVAQKEKIIHQTDYHLTQFLRNYRNLIHPSVELRKTMNIETEEAELIWGILKKIIKDIL